MLKAMLSQPMARKTDEDIEWLLRQPRDLERDHIEAVLRKSVELLYGKEK